MDDFYAKLHRKLLKKIAKKKQRSFLWSQRPSTVQVPATEPHVFERQICNGDEHCPVEDFPNWYCLIDSNYW